MLPARATVSPCAVRTASLCDAFVRLQGDLRYPDDLEKLFSAHQCVEYSVP